MSEHWIPDCLPVGDYYGGVDIAKSGSDWAVVALVRRYDLVNLRLMHVNVFPQGTEFTGIVGYLQFLKDRVRILRKLLMDRTGMGEGPLEMAQHSLGVELVGGINLSAPEKQEVLGYLKLLMEDRRFSFPYELSYIQELNTEQFELSKSGQILFSHPGGTHDDRFWATALAVYASKSEPTPESAPDAVVGE